MRIEWLLLMAGSVTLGCGPAISEDELGNVVYGVPAVPGAEIPYPLPELEVTTGEGESHEGHAH